MRIYQRRKCLFLLGLILVISFIPYIVFQLYPPGHMPNELDALNNVDMGSTNKRSFTYNFEHFLLDGKQFRYIAGAVHYFRIRPEYWNDRLLKVKEMGLNAIDVYVPWNWHEAEKGRVEFSGDRDLLSFIRLAHSIGLLVILRPGPYICAEWDWGGLPAWLLREPDAMRMRVRSSDERFMRHVRDWFDQLLPRLAPLTIARGGPIIMAQVENEYVYVRTCACASAYST